MRAEGVEVQNLDVVEILQVFDHEFPIAIELDHMLGREPCFLMLQKREFFLVFGDEFSERAGIGIEIDKHPAAPFTELERF